jgi:VWFA-related protein
LFTSIKNPAFLACVLAAASPSQNTPAIRSNVDLVTIPCIVVDAHGVAVHDLTRDEFRVFDNGVGRKLENLWLDTDLPLTLGVIIDGSESQQAQLAEHRETASALLQRILRPGDRGFVVSVDEDVRLWVDLTTTAADVGKQMTRSRGDLFGQPCPKRESNVPGIRPTSVCGASPLWNAVYDAARLKLRPLTGNKALLILTDGFDSGSTHDLKDAIDEAQRADTSVYAIQYPGSFGGRYAPALYRLLGETSGTWFRPPRGEYGPIVSRLETDLRRRYVLGFRPERMSFGKVRHEVRVEVTRPNLSARARKTYFQTPQ